jgi:integrase/recombinase XerD
MAVVMVFARHSEKCPKSKEKNAGQYRRCKCPLWLQWGKNGKKSAKTRSWEIATKKARQLEEELECFSRGVEPPKKADHITIEAAASLYLDDMVQRGIKDCSKARRMLTRMRDYASTREVILLKDVSARLLTEWRSKWTFKVKSGSPAVHWSIVKTFFRWAYATDLVLTDPSAKLKSLPSVRTQVQPLTKEEMERLLRATGECGFDSQKAYKVRTFILLQRWSALSCMDAATLRRDGLNENNVLKRKRNKTGAEVCVPLPPAVAEMLRALPNDDPDYFFWNPNRMAKKSIVALYGDLLRAVFDKAGVPHGREEMLSHRFRHTFSVEMLLAEVPIERVAILLGHRTVRTTEKYYSAWVPERQTRLEAEVKDAWKRMVLPELLPVQGTVQ